MSKCPSCDFTSDDSLEFTEHLLEPHVMAADHYLAILQDDANAVRLARANATFDESGFPLDGTHA